jgi:tRNA pseudouridine55 synthase
MRGVLNVNKPSGITSYDVIRQLKPLIGKTRIGHAGTLDPLANGVLLVLLGAATKVADLLQHQEKEYIAQVRLGVRTDSDDITGRVLEEQPVPPLDEAQLTALLSEFEGKGEQVPPAFSALKIGGVPAYQLARQGKNPQLAARKVRIRQISITEVDLPCFTFRAIVSRGTYIRSLARDIGDRLACGATMQALTRVRIGNFRVADAFELENLTPALLAEKTIPIDRALEFLPVVTVKPEAVTRLRNGQVLDSAEITGGVPETDLVRVTDPDNRVLMVSECQGGKLKPVRGIYDDGTTG